MKFPSVASSQRLPSLRRNAAKSSGPRSLTSRDFPKCFTSMSVVSLLLALLDEDFACSALAISETIQVAGHAGVDLDGAFAALLAEVGAYGHLEFGLFLDKRDFGHGSVNLAVKARRF